VITHRLVRNLLCFDDILVDGPAGRVAAVRLHAACTCGLEYDIQGASLFDAAHRLTEAVLAHMAEMEQAGEPVERWPLATD
jgi:hypothetical protein